MSKDKPEVGDIWKSKESGTVFILTRKDVLINTAEELKQDD